MTTLADIITILKNGTYPYPLQIRTGERAYHLYPSIEVTQPKPGSPVSTPETATKEFTFEIKIYIRFTRKLADETTDLEAVEGEVLTQLKQQPLQDTEFFFQSENWSRTDTKDVHGIESVLLVSYREIEPFQEGTSIGAGSTLQIEGVIVKLIGSATGDEGRLFSDLWEDDGARFPIEGGLVGTRFFEYAWDDVSWNNLQGKIDRGEYVTAILTEANAVQRTVTVLPVRQRDNVSFTGLKTVVIQMELQKDIPTIEGSQWLIGIDAVIVNS
jgi:hypothetical protein